MQSIGRKSFSLEAHLPYLAYRASRLPRLDPRQGLDGHRLRNCHLLGSTSLQDPGIASGGLKDYFYEAQVSIVVTGFDEWKWTAYCFEDAYFEDDEHRKKREVDQGTALNPLSVEKHCLDTPIWDPREYFLSVFAARVEKATQEWSNLISRVLESLERKNRHVSTALYGLALSY